MTERGGRGGGDTMTYGELVSLEGDPNLLGNQSDTELWVNSGQTDQNVVRWHGNVSRIF